MHYALRNNLYYCVSNDRVAFLDIKDDRYFCLPSAIEADFRTLQDKQSSEELEPEALLRLVQAGILTPTSSNSTFATPCNIVRPTRSALESLDQQVSGSLLMRAVLSHFSFLVTHGTLESRIARIRDQKARDTGIKGNSSNHNGRQLLTAFQKTTRLISTQDQCLRSSQALIHFLTAHGFFPSFVLGVRFKPFRAHAWVQDGETVLNNTVDDVLPFTPILVI
jgi:hypothetical protein